MRAKTRKRKSNLYTDDNPQNTIPIRFKTVGDVENTIAHLEKLRRNQQYSLIRLKQVALVLYARLRVLRTTKPRQFAIARKYYEFLKSLGKNKTMKNLVGAPLEVCSTQPMTGYTRDGYCRNVPGDAGTHVVCAKVTDEFLQYTKTKGNNLITPSPENQFPGLKAGDKWCLCALRWGEARKAGKAPPVVVSATDHSALQFNPLDVYFQHSLK